MKPTLCVILLLVHPVVSSSLENEVNFLKDFFAVRHVVMATTSLCWQKCNLYKKKLPLKMT